MLLVLLELWSVDGLYHTMSHNISLITPLKCFKTHQQCKKVQKIQLSDSSWLQLPVLGHMLFSVPTQAANSNTQVHELYKKCYSKCASVTNSGGDRTGTGLSHLSEAQSS